MGKETVKIKLWKDVDTVAKLSINVDIAAKFTINVN